MADRKRARGDGEHWSSSLEARARARQSLQGEAARDDAAENLESTEKIHLQQVELELQNEELREARDLLEISRLKYFHLFDLAPVGYIVLEESGGITEMNLRAAEMLGTTRERIKRGSISLGSFISGESHFLLGQHLAAVLRDSQPQSCQIHLLHRQGAGESVVRLVSVKIAGSAGSSIFCSLTDITELIEAREKLQQSERRFRELFEHQPSGIVTVSKNEDDGACLVENLNASACKLFAVNHNSVQGRDLLSVLPGFRDCHLKLALERSLDGSEPLILPSVQYQDEGHSFWADFHFFRLPSGELVIVVRDITTQVENHHSLQQSELLKSSIIAALPDALILLDEEGGVQDVFAAPNASFAAPVHELKGVFLHDFLPAAVAGQYLEKLQAALKAGSSQKLEYAMPVAEETRHFEARLQAAGKDRVVALVRDVSEEKRDKDRLRHMSTYDQLTGAYNRASFEEEVKNFEQEGQYPVSLISADLDGLKLVNDTLGHEFGDRLLLACAGVLRRGLGEKGLLARLGGDEFVLLLPGTHRREAEHLIAHIQEGVAEYNRGHPRLPLSVSLGLAAAEKQDRRCLDELLKEADDLMYREKLSRGHGTRNRIVQTLLAALAERDFITEGHTQRLAELCDLMGRRWGLTSKQLADLHLLAQVHDLGKVGVPDHILFKAGPLSEEEWQIMQLHSEKGFRIAMSSPELSTVADLILKHHERYDGSGYPLGLKGEEIPVECRILAIVDAFDAMTNQRPYNRVKSAAEAAEEIRACSGYHFDPEFVKLFLEVFTLQ